MTKTFKELTYADRVIAALYQKDPSLEQTKFAYSYKRFVEKNLAPISKEFSQKLQDARVQYALEEETTKKLITDTASPRGYAYSRQGEMDVIKAERAIEDEYESKEVEVEPLLFNDELPAAIQEYLELLDMFR